MKIGRIEHAKIKLTSWPSAHSTQHVAKNRHAPTTIRTHRVPSSKWHLSGYESPIIYIKSLIIQVGVYTNEKVLQKWKSIFLVFIIVRKFLSLSQSFPALRCYTAYVFWSMCRLPYFFIHSCPHNIHISRGNHDGNVDKSL